MADREELIRRLASELQPANRLRAPSVLAALWLLGSWAFVVAATLVAAPMRPTFAQQLVSVPRFAGETLLGVGSGVLAIGVAFALGVPGPGSTRARVTLAFAGIGLWAAAYGYGLIDPTLEPSMLGKRPYCSVEVFVYGLPVLVGGLLLLRRLAPLARATTGAVVGAAAGAIPALLMQLACMYIPAHILGFHIAPIAALVVVGALLGPISLRRI